jgi:hypothetical protein
VIEFRDINLEPDVRPASAPGSRTCVAGCMRLMQRAACTSALIARSPFGFEPLATCGSAGCLRDQCLPELRHQTQVHSRQGARIRVGIMSRFARPSSAG